MTAPEADDLRWAYDVLADNRAVRLNSSLEALWADRPRYVSLELSQNFTAALTQSLADTAFMLREDLVLPQGFRVYGIHDIVLNCLCAERAGSGGVDIVFFSGVVAAPLLRFAAQVMLSQLDPGLTFTFPDGHVGDLDEIAECVLGYTIWHLIEDIPIVLADLSKVLSDDDLERVATTLDGLTSFLFFHEVGHIACRHLELQHEIVQFTAGGGPSDIRAPHEFEADAFAVGCFKPEYRATVIFYVRIFLEIIADLETLGFDFGPSHPKATARVRRLMETFQDEIDDLQRGLLARFLDNREELATRRRANEAASRSYLAPVGGGRTRRRTIRPGQSVLQLPTKQVCHFALEALIAAYREAVAKA